VKAAQSAALEVARAGALTKEPDEAARAWFRRFGLDKYFIHRLGHGESVLRGRPSIYVDSGRAGIGLQGHEQPYLRGGSDDIIQTGHTFSNEPGIYIEDKVSHGICMEFSRRRCNFSPRSGCDWKIVSTSMTAVCPDISQRVSADLHIHHGRLEG
jgi:hypothetical protein